MKSRLLLVSVLVILILGGLLVPRPAQACQPVYHIVKPGENLSQIAAYYGVTVQAIVQANNLWNPNYIYVGQYLLIPVPCEPSPPTGCYKTHVVKRGEYLKVIAARYGVSVTAIVNANGIKNPNLIYPGQRLKIPTECKPEPKPTPSPTGPWSGAYWNNRNLAGSPHFTRNEKAVNFDWGVTSPGNGINHDNFSARWTRTRKFDAAGWYRFTIRVDDGVRLWVDGKLLIDKWRDTAPTTYYIDTYLAAGNHKLAVEYYEHTGGAQIRLQITAISAPTAQPGPTSKPPDQSL
jgi:LysM repeat protein